MRSYHPFLYLSPSRPHVDVDSSIVWLVDSSFDVPGDVVPRSDTLPKDVAGSKGVDDTVPSIDTGENKQRCRTQKRGDHAERRATRAGVSIMPIGRRHRRLAGAVKPMGWQQRRGLVREGQQHCSRRCAPLFSPLCPRC